MTTESDCFSTADWKLDAACRGRDTDAFFTVRAAGQHAATRICRNCTVRYECLGDALDQRVEWGVWGGLTESERRAVLRRFPQVTSWRRLLRQARAQELEESRRAGVTTS